MPTCYVPFELLSLDGLSPRPNRGRPRLVIEENGRSFVYLPVIGALPGSRRQQSESLKAKEIACVACPDGIELGPQPVLNNGGLSFKPLGVSEPLPGTVAECLAVGAVFDAEVPQIRNHPSYSGETVEIHTGAYHATKEWVRICGEDFRILHIASHAFVNNAFPGFSGIVLHGCLGAEAKERILYQYELQTLNLETEMITLSCCSTAEGEYGRGEGVLGLSQSLWLAGARSSVTTLWEVSDEFTKELMVDFYTNLKQGMDRDVSLAEAKRRAISRGISPFHWAQFVFSGDWRPLYPKRRRQGQ